jgi:mannitol/fructose-specific phosphotransferase system IIA component (Ntr-type)
LGNVTQTDAAVEQSQLSNRAGRNANRGDEPRGIDCGGRLNRLQSELEPRAVLRLRGIPHDGGGTQREGRGNRKSRPGNAPERGPHRLLSGRSRGGEQQQSNKQQANALHAERLLKAVAQSTQVNYLQPVTALGHTPLRLSELLTPDRIRVPIRAQSKEGVLRELVDLLVGGNGAAPDVLQAVMERERQFPTGIGYGVAVPHGKTPALANLVAVAGTARTPVPYETVDGEPVRLFFLLAGPESQAGAHVKALSRISRLVRREPIRARLLEARDAQEFYRILVDAERGGA